MKKILLVMLVVILINFFNLQMQRINAETKNDDKWKIVREDFH